MDVNWQPPTEAEMKVIQARRERSDKISSVMGEYLLKGYKMLATVCSTCNTVLLQDKQNQIICIACSEIDAENAKDDPALSEEAARSQVREYEMTRQEHTSRRSSTPNLNQSNQDLSISHPVQINILGNSIHEESSSETSLQQCKENLLLKINWASSQLKNSNSINESIDYCKLIKSCAEALAATSSLKI